MILLEISRITSQEIANLLDSMREKWNSTRIMGRMFEPVFQSSPDDPMWIYVFTLWRTWMEGIRNLILIIDFDETNQSCTIQIIGKSLRGYERITPNDKLEREVAKFLTDHLS